MLANHYNIQKCPECGIFIEKMSTCNWVRCESLKCQKKTVFCFICGEILESNVSSHYINENPFSRCKFNSK